ncbi:hypothetical protein BCR41DRAFT_399338 [Lobosporangium transversale]|uniref:Uncharacterized protein n=1 Tax=Lobosporangium transversale TaxID=64571 RepID=A0A1Y2G5L7_9FUNG|nr:hypothetical protein BCR41DRAFT_402274 [Lobosporangium transversale]XP_021878350.1 hypothetical protein BCR41DRAFT_399338 [Lobosporangium transversale]ORY95190.1 hypothetical protein BCR41DRAFT_402274 [Lobosporangium transversale]ORZ08267.1 hypothetical protein BCR41DRAFT_399338 [Lobosporangium transversale]|eukprot:XP_021875390.1 hypothetical protein BCR41DRAFT_402274 [Lobosporangium transversale]
MDPLPSANAFPSTSSLMCLNTEAAESLDCSLCQKKPSGSNARCMTWKLTQADNREPYVHLQDPYEQEWVKLGDLDPKEVEQAFSLLEKWENFSDLNVDDVERAFAPIEKGVSRN